jgi:phage gp29-like protein
MFAFSTCEARRRNWLCGAPAQRGMLRNDTAADRDGAAFAAISWIGHQRNMRKTAQSIKSTSIKATIYPVMSRQFCATIDQRTLWTNLSCVTPDVF